MSTPGEYDDKEIRSARPGFWSGGCRWIAIQELGGGDDAGQWVMAVAEHATSPAPLLLVWMPRS